MDVLRRLCAVAAVGGTVLSGCSGLGNGTAAPSNDVPIGNLPTAPGSMPLAYSAVQFGKPLDTSYGHHSVLSMTDPADVAAVSPPAGSHVVSALVEECASPSQGTKVSARYWRLVVGRGRLLPSTGGFLPPVAGAPALPASHRLAPDQCGLADLAFVVPDGVSATGLRFVEPGAPHDVWREPPG
ncbi:MAG: hypothetical protein ACRDP1_10915 [Nocardioidaceae bacterium]